MAVLELKIHIFGKCMGKRVTMNEGLEIFPSSPNQALGGVSLWQPVQGTIAYKHWKYLPRRDFEVYLFRLALTLQEVLVHKLTKFDMLVQCC